MADAITAAQQRLLQEIRTQGGAEEGGAEYWPVVNDWVKGGPGLALRNINRTVEALIRAGRITIDEDGYFHIVP